MFLTNYSRPVKNLIIGGDFGINPWQRGTSFTSVGNTLVSADRIKYFKSGTMVQDIIKRADAPTQAQSGNLITDCFDATVTTAQASLTSSNFCSIDHVVEGYSWRKLAGKPFTLSFWVKATVTGVYSVAFGNNGGDRSLVATYTVNASNTWEYKTIAVTTGSPSAGSWNYINAVGIRIRFTMAADTGSAFATSTFNTWQTGNFFWSNTQVNGVSAISNTWRIANIQLEEGIIASPFEHRTIQEELLLCQRYYEKTYDMGVAPGSNSTNGLLQVRGANGILANTSGSLDFSDRFQVRKRAAPTVTLYSIDGTASAIDTSGGKRTGVTSSQASEVTPFRFLSVDATSATIITVGTAVSLQWTADAEL